MFQKNAKMIIGEKLPLNQLECWWGKISYMSKSVNNFKEW